MLAQMMASIPEISVTQSAIHLTSPSLPTRSFRIRTPPGPI